MLISYISCLINCKGMISISTLNAQLETANLKKQVVENLSRGGFKLTKFQSNVEELSENAEEKEASVLGLSWRTNSDTLAKCQMNDRPVEGFSQRDFLSVVFSLFDPLGLLSPDTIRLRKILKKMEAIWSGLG